MGWVGAFARWIAIGVMIPIWSMCTERERVELTREEILDIHPDLPGLADAIVGAGLGRDAGEDRVYICGATDLTRWLGVKRAKARENGAKHKGRPPKTDEATPETDVGTNVGTDVGFQENQDGIPNSGALTLAPALALATCSESKAEEKTSDETDVGFPKTTKPLSRTALDVQAVEQSYPASYPHKKPEPSRIGKWIATAGRDAVIGVIQKYPNHNANYHEQAISTEAAQLKNPTTTKGDPRHAAIAAALAE